MLISIRKIIQAILPNGWRPEVISTVEKERMTKGP